MVCRNLRAIVLVFVVFVLVFVSAGSDCVSPYSADIGECNERTTSWLMKPQFTVNGSTYVGRGVDASGNHCSIQKYMYSAVNQCQDFFACWEDMATTEVSFAATFRRVNSSANEFTDERASKVTLVGLLPKFRDDRDRYALHTLVSHHISHTSNR